MEVKIVTENVWNSIPDFPSSTLHVCMIHLRIDNALAAQELSQHESSINNNNKRQAEKY